MKKSEFPTLPVRLKQVKTALINYNSSTGSKIEIGCYSQRESLESDSGLATTDCWVAIDLEGSPEEIQAIARELKVQGFTTNEKWYQLNPFSRAGKPYEVRLKFNALQG